MLPHLVRLSGASEMIPPGLIDVKRFFDEFSESTRRWFNRYDLSPHRFSYQGGRPVPGNS